MTSLFSRLQKLNKDERWTIREDGGELDVLDAEGCSVAHADLGWPGSRQNVFAMVECRNSLPAVLNLVEAAQRSVSPHEDVGEAVVAREELERAVAVFVTPEGDRSTMSGQEEQP